MPARDTHTTAKHGYVTATPGMAMLATAEHHKSKQTAWGCDVGYDVVMHRLHNHRHEWAPLPLYKRVINL